MLNRTGHGTADRVNKEVADIIGRGCEDNCALVDERTS